MSRSGSSFVLFDGISSNEYNLVCTSTSSGLYNDSLVGSRSIREEKIEGRPSPYFFGVEESPLSFSMRLSLYDVEYNELTNQHIDKITKWLIRDTYKTLVFENNPDKIYHVIFDGSPSIIHNGLNKGYIDLNARSLYPYPMTRNQKTPSYSVVNTGVVNLNNTGKKNVFPNIDIPFIAGGQTIIIKNLTNGSEISFVDYSESGSIHVDGYNRISVVRSEGLDRTISPNTRWLYLSSGVNNIEITATWINVEFNWSSGIYG